VSTLDHKLKLEGTEVRRLEVIMGTGRWRRFSADFKARVVEETLVMGAIVSDIARRHGLTPQQVFTWRRQARRLTCDSDPAAPSFVPAVVEAMSSDAISESRHRRAPRWEQIYGRIEVEISGMTVRIGRGADAKTVAAVLRALRSGT
jgi:transposase